MTDAELQKQFSPSQWNKRMPPEVICDHHVKVVTNQTIKNKKEIPVKENVAYGGKSTELMDIYGIDLPKDSPIFVYIHGGYWAEFDKNMSGYAAKPLYEAGIKCVVPDYDLAPKVTITDIVGQIRGVWFCGASAGAHLAACLLNEGWLSDLEPNVRRFFRGVALITGVYDLTPLLKTEVNDLVKMNESEAKVNSPQNYVRRFKEKQLVCDEFKIIIAVAENDSPAFKKQSENYNEELKKNGMDVDFMVMAGLDHYNIMEDLIDPKSLLTTKIVSELTKKRE